MSKDKKTHNRDFMNSTGYDHCVLNDAAASHYAALIADLRQRIAAAGPVSPRQIAKTRDLTPRPLRILDIGTGEISVLLAAVHDFCSAFESLEMRLNIETSFLDIRTFPQGIRGKPAQDSYRPGDSGEWSDVACGKIKFKSRFIHTDFNNLIGTAENQPGETENSLANEKFDIIVLNFVLHEIFDSATLEMFFPEYQTTKRLNSNLFLQRLFECLYKMLDEKGVVLLGDAYFPRYVTSEQSEQLLDVMRKQARHADAPLLFFHPEKLIATIFEYLGERFILRRDSERLLTVQIDDGKFLSRKTYFIIFEKE